MTAVIEVASTLGRTPRPAPHPTLRRAHRVRTARSVAAADTAPYLGVLGLASAVALFAQAGIAPIGYALAPLMYAVGAHLFTRAMLRTRQDDGSLRLWGWVRHFIKRGLPAVLIAGSMTLFAAFLFADVPTQLERLRTKADGLAASQWWTIPAGEMSMGGTLRLVVLFGMCGAAWGAVVLVIGQLHRLGVPKGSMVWALLGAPALVFAAAGGVALFDARSASLFAAFAVGAVTATVAEITSRRKVAERARRGARREAPARGGRSVTIGLSVVGIGAALGATVALVVAPSSPVVPALGLVLMLVLVTGRGALAWFLALPPLVALGRIAFILVLVQGPVLWSVGAVAPQSTPYDVAVVGIPIALLLAGALHHLVVEPLRRVTWSRAGVVIVSIATAALCAGVYLVVALPA